MKSPRFGPGGCRGVNRSAVYRAPCAPQEEYQKKGQFTKAKSVLCIHNIAFQVRSMLCIAPGVHVTHSAPRGMLLLPSGAFYRKEACQGRLGVRTTLTL